MRTLLVIAAAFSSTGCIGLASAAASSLVVEVLEAHGEHEAANAPPTTREEESRVAQLRELSRKRLYPPEGPRCAVNVVPTGQRTWQLRSCDGELRCWALDEGFACDERPAPAPSGQL